MGATECLDEVQITSMVDETAAKEVVTNIACQDHVLLYFPTPRYISVTGGQMNSKVMAIMCFQKMRFGPH